MTSLSSRPCNPALLGFSSETAPSPSTWSEGFQGSQRTERGLPERHHEARERTILSGRPSCLLTGRVTSSHCGSVSCKRGIMVPASKVSLRICKTTMCREWLPIAGTHKCQPVLSFPEHSVLLTRWPLPLLYTTTMSLTFFYTSIHFKTPSHFCKYKTSSTWKVPLFSQCSLDAHYVPGTVLGAGDTAVNRRPLALTESAFRGETDSEQTEIDCGTR